MLTGTVTHVVMGSVVLLIVATQEDGCFTVPVDHRMFHHIASSEGDIIGRLISYDPAPSEPTIHFLD